MTSTPTATKVLDAFLAARVPTTSAETTERRSAVIERFRGHVEAGGAMTIDDLTARRLLRDGGRAPTEHELAAVLSVVGEVTGFFEHLAEAADASPELLAGTAGVVRDLAAWLVERDLVDADVAQHLEGYTHLFDAGEQLTGT